MESEQKKNLLSLLETYMEELDWDHAHEKDHEHKTFLSQRFCWVQEHRNRLAEELDTEGRNNEFDFP
jgi:hypothetical protein